MASRGRQLLKMEPLRVGLLGGFRIESQGTMVVALRQRAQQLIAYLLLHRHTPQPRRQVAARLWPETSDAQARTNLRKELHYLRHTWPATEQLIAIANQSLHWQPQIPCAVDIEQFESGVSAAADLTGQAAIAALETALELYYGDLWPDCDAPWIYPERERLRQQYVRAMARGTQLLQAVDPPRAITLGQQWLSAAPLDEGAYQTLMALYADTGDRATALQLYHQCMTTLQEELGVDPSATTSELYQRLLRADGPAADSPRPPTPQLITTYQLPSPSRPLVGREALCQDLAQWLGMPPVSEAVPLLLLTGEPGIGKTSLLETLVQQAAQQDISACWGQAFAAEQLRSYGTWIDLLQSVQHAPQLSALAADLRQASENNLRNREQLLDAVAQGIEVATGAEGLLLVIDDLHWLDDASATLLHYLLRRLGQSLRVACAARSLELQENPVMVDLLGDLRRAGRLQEIAVPPLSATAIAALIQPAQPGDSPHDPQQIYADSGGNPLFALEAARSETHQGSSLTALVGDRLQRLDPTARELLPWAAALGRQFNPETLALAAGYPPLQFLTAIEQLEAQQIIRPSPASTGSGATGQPDYDFVHAILRQVAYDQLSAPRRRLIHGQLATALNSQAVENDRASQVAYHAALAGNHALAALACYAAATRSLKLFAYDDVIQLVAQGLSHCPHLPTSDRLLRMAQLLRLRVLAGVSAEKATDLEWQLQQLLGEMVGLTVPEAEVVGREALTLLAYYQEDLAAVHQYALNALADLPQSPRLQAESLAANGCCMAEIERDMNQAEAVLLEAQTLAKRLGLVLVDIPIGLACVKRYRGRYDEAYALLRQTLKLTQNRKDMIRQGYSLGYLAMTGWDSGDAQRTDAQALLELAHHLPRGSDGAFAEALLALDDYAISPAEVTALDQAIDQLNQLDAQRKLAFVASHACEVAIASSQPDRAQHFAAISHQAAQRANHPIDIVTAIALQTLSAAAAEKRQYYPLLMQASPAGLQLSARARLLHHQAIEAVQQAAIGAS